MQTLINQVNELNRSLPRTIEKSEMEALFWKIKDVVEKDSKVVLSELSTVVEMGRADLRADSVDDFRYALVRLFTDLALKFRGRYPG